MTEYGKRGGMKALDTGARPVVRTYGKEALLSFSNKTSGVRVFENDAERLVSKLVGLDPRVRRFLPQPFTVDLFHGKLLRTAEQRDAAVSKYASVKGPRLYTPDFYVEFADGRLLVFEVKLDRYPGSEADRERFEKARSVFTNHGYEFLHIVMPADFRHPLRSNIVLLHQAALREDMRPEDEVCSRVEALAQNGARTLAEFAAGLGISVNLIPHLVVCGVLSFDAIAHRLEGATPMEAAHGSLDHLSLLERLAR